MKQSTLSNNSQENMKSISVEDSSFIFQEKLEKIINPHLFTIVGHNNFKQNGNLNHIEVYLKKNHVNFY